MQLIPESLVYEPHWQTRELAHSVTTQKNQKTQRANLPPIPLTHLPPTFVSKESHSNFKTGNVQNGPNLLQLILDIIKDYLYSTYGILRKLNCLSNWFPNKSRIVKSRAGMISKSKFILALNNF